MCNFVETQILLIYNTNVKYFIWKWTKRSLGYWKTEFCRRRMTIFKETRRKVSLQTNTYKFLWRIS